MIKLYLATLLTFGITLCSVAQIPNPGFENWNSVGFPSYLDPAGWGTLNGSTNIIGIRTIERASGADVHSGTYALKASSRFISFANQTAPGITATGTINTNTQAIEGGFPFNQRPSQLRGWYKYSPANNDTAVVEVTLFKWNSTTGQRVTVAEGKMNNPATVSAYTQFYIPLTYYTTDVPDTARIILFSSASDNPQDGSAAFYDDLSFFTCNVSTTTSSTNATCTAANGSASVQLNTANSQGITYLWSNGGTTATVSAIPAGNYTVTATDGDGCSASASVSVASNVVLLNLSSSTTSSSCTANTGSATVSVVGGTAPYTYDWNNGDSTVTISNIGAGSYSVTVADANGCAGISSATVSTPNGPSATAFPTDATCNGSNTGAVNLSISGGSSPYNISWSTGSSTEDLTAVEAGTYTVTVSDANSCSFTLSSTVNEPGAVAVSLDATNASTSTSSDGIIVANAGGGTQPYSYVWSNSTNAATVAGLSPGVYCVTITDFNSCTQSACDTVSAPSSLLEEEETSFSVYPNPANNTLNITTDFSGNTEIVIVSSDGKILFTEQMTAQLAAVDISRYASGSYLLMLSDKVNGRLWRKRFQILK